jgi:hypothetical protein
MQQFTAIIIDVAGSKRYPTSERNQLQDRLVNHVQILNEAFASLLAKSVDFSGGDEVQGLFFDVLSAYLYYRLLEIYMLPYQIRGGIGTGAWMTRVPTKGTAAQDGFSYHMARKAIELAHGLKTQSLCVEAFDASYIEINLLLNASIILRRELSPAQLEVLKLMEVRYPFNSVRMIDTQKLTRLLTQTSEAIDSEQFLHDDIDLVRSIDIIPEEKISLRNMVSELAQCNKTSVQNVSKLIQRGNLLSIRSIDYYVACKLLELKDV